MLESVNRVEIDHGALMHNLRVCASRADSRPVLAMVKADGYGHGMVECAHSFVKAGATALGVAEPVEGVRLRQASVACPVLVMTGILPGMGADLVAHGLTPVLLDGSLFDEFAAIGMQTGRPVAVYLKVDAGMGRQGSLPEEIPHLVEKIAGTPGLVLLGLLAHFPMADQADSDSSRRVNACFTGIAARIKQKSRSSCVLSLANSGGIFHFPDSCCDLVRPGIALYGYYPDGKSGSLRRGTEEPLQPAMRFVSRICQVRVVPEESGLGYGHIFTTRRETRLAILPVGYEDGYLRSLSNRASVLVRGCRAPVVGRISMNLTMLDVTDIPGVEAGDEAVLLGRQGRGEITADEIAEWLGTISYEVLCLFGNLNTRAHIN